MRLFFCNNPARSAVFTHALLNVCESDILCTQICVQTRTLLTYTLNLTYYLINLDSFLFVISLSYVTVCFDE